MFIWSLLQAIALLTFVIEATKQPVVMPLSGSQVPLPAKLPDEPDPFINNSERAGWVEYIGRLMIEAGLVTELTQAIAFLDHLGPGCPLATQKMIEKSKSIFIAAQNTDKSNPSSNPIINEPANTSVTNIVRILLSGRYKTAQLMYFEMVEADRSKALTSSQTALSVLFFLVNLDTLSPKAALPLWRESWELGVTDKLAIVQYAEGKYADRIGDVIKLPESIAHRNAIKARVLINSPFREIKYDRLNDLLNTPELKKDTTETSILTAALFQRTKQHCKALELYRQALKKTTCKDDKQDLLVHFERASRMCDWKKLSKQYKSYCQIGANKEFLISSNLEPMALADAVAQKERLFWANFYAANCDGAQNVLNDISNDIRQKKNEQSTLQLKHLESSMAVCHSNQPANYPTLDANQIFGHLQQGQWSKAFDQWKQRYGKQVHASTVAQLLYIGLMVWRYPKAAVPPCIGNILVGDHLKDLKLLEMTDIVATNQPRDPCAPMNDECHSMRLKAYFIAGDTEHASRHASMLSLAKQMEPKVMQITACLKMCSRFKSSKQICESEQMFGHVLKDMKGVLHESYLQGIHSENIELGYQLSGKICRDSNQPVADPFLLRHGTVIYPVTELFRIEKLLPYKPKWSSSLKRALQDAMERNGPLMPSQTTLSSPGLNQGALAGFGGAQRLSPTPIVQYVPINTFSQPVEAYPVSIPGVIPNYATSMVPLSDSSNIRKKTCCCKSSKSKKSKGSVDRSKNVDEFVDELAAKNNNQPSDEELAKRLKRDLASLSERSKGTDPLNLTSQLPTQILERDCRDALISKFPSLADFFATSPSKHPVRISGTSFARPSNRSSMRSKRCADRKPRI